MSMWAAPNHRSMTARFVSAITPKSSKSGKKIKKNIPSDSQAGQDVAQKTENDDPSYTVDPELGERRYLGSVGSVWSEAATLVPADDTELLHGLAHHETNDEEGEWKSARMLGNPALPGQLVEVIDPKVLAANEQRLASLPSEIWLAISSFMTPADAANLAMSNKTLYTRLGPKPWHDLRLPENKEYKTEFLLHMDRHLPNHLFCFPCGTYHLRTQNGREKLEPSYVLNPLFACPNVRTTTLPRTRLAHGRELPFAFVQLALRAHRHAPSYGISPNTLSRRWKDKDGDWSHHTRFVISKGHLLFRCVSMSFAPPGMTPSQERLLLYSRDDYTPYFSVCAHWQDGELMPLCKCAVSHIPRPRASISEQLHKGPRISFDAARPNLIATLCDDCRPMRRCPSCPTEYMLELRLTEDKRDAVHRFKHALVVTRWSDLGDGTSPVTSPEWAACNGRNDGSEKFDSFKAAGRRAISGWFESAVSNSVPGQRILSLNPKLEAKGEDGNGWY